MKTNTNTNRTSKEIKKEAKKAINCQCKTSIVILSRVLDYKGHGIYHCWCPGCGQHSDISR